jgi:sec-independent protein translocase protein TatB
MFDVGFWELAIIGVVALLVIGPERLPKVARTVGMWLGRARRMVASVKADIDRELAAEELKKTLARQAESESLYEILEDTKQSIDPGLNTAEVPADADSRREDAAPQVEAPVDPAAPQPDGDTPDKPVTDNRSHGNG